MSGRVVVRLEDYRDGYQTKQWVERNWVRSPALVPVSVWYVEDQSQLEQVTCIQGLQGVVSLQGLRG